MMIRLPVGRAVAAFVKRRYRPALFPQLSRKAVARGAMLMVMIANRCAGELIDRFGALPEPFEPLRTRVCEARAASGAVGDVYSELT